MNELITIPFNNQTITAIDHNGQPYIAMRPIVENLGLDWKSQHVKINDKFNRCVVILTMHDNTGRKQKMLCLSVSKIAAFLYSINANKVKPHLRDTILFYQEQCDTVLDAYFRDALQHHSQYYQNKYATLRQGIFAQHPNWSRISLGRQAGDTLKTIAQRIHRHPSTVSRALKKMTAYGIDCQPPQRLAA